LLVDGVDLRQLDRPTGRNVGYVPRDVCYHGSLRDN
jgi:hypothetical protein